MLNQTTEVWRRAGKTWLRNQTVVEKVNHVNGQQTGADHLAVTVCLALSHNEVWYFYRFVVAFSEIASSPLTSCARLLDQACSRELALMRACPTCYLNRMPAIHVLPSTPKVLPLLTKQEWLRSANSMNEMVAVDQKTEELKLSDTSPLDPWWFCKLCVSFSHGVVSLFVCYP